MDSTTTDTSPQSKRHSFPAVLSYSETLSVLSEHQRQYNDKEITQKSKTPSINSKGNDEERKEKLQQAVEWLRGELKDMYHQDKFLLRQFNHLNRTIQDLKEKQELKEAAETKKLEAESLKEVVQLKKQQTTQQVYSEKQKENKQELSQLQDPKPDKNSLNEYDSDYGSDQSMDRFEDDFQPLKNVIIVNSSPKMSPKERNTKRWTWWK